MCQDFGSTFSKAQTNADGFNNWQVGQKPKIVSEAQLSQVERRAFNPSVGSTPGLDSLPNDALRVCGCQMEVNLVEKTLMEMGIAEEYAHKLATDRNMNDIKSMTADEQPALGVSKDDQTFTDAMNALAELGNRQKKRGKK